MPSMAQMDRDIYNSLKSMYETLMLQMVRKIQDDDVTWRNDFDKLKSVFDNTADDCCRLLTESREKE